MKTRQEIKALSKEAVAGQRGTAILLELVYLGVAVGFGIILGILGAILGFANSVAAAVVLGVLIFALYIAFILVIIVMVVNAYGEHIKVYRREPASVAAMFTGLKVNFGRKLGGVLWMELWVMLWSMLLIIPGIIKSLAYSMTVPILAEHPNVTARQALKISMRMTDGHKLDIFVFSLSFIGWWILSILTLGILYIVYVGPYFYTSFSGLYTELRDKALAEGKITREELGMDAPQPVHEPVVIN